MSTKTYICIDLDEFHENQKDAETKASIKFISAKNTEGAKRAISLLYPNKAWTVIPKTTIDKNIVSKIEKD